MILTYNNYFLLGKLEKGDNDDVRYIRSAVTLLQKGILTYHNTNTPTTFIMPGISFTLAFFIKLFGVWGGVTAFRVFQVLLQAIGILLIFYIARELFSSSVAIVAAIIDALYLPEIFCSGLILTEGIFKFFIILLTYICAYGLKTKKISYYIFGGFIWGIACLFRPTIALFPGVTLVMWVIHKYTLKEILKYTLITFAVFAAVMSPWWVRNYLTFDKFIPLSQSTGNPFLQGTYIGYTPRLQDPEYLRAIRLGNSAEMELGKKRIKKIFKERPLQYLYWYTVGKTAYYWKQPFYWRIVLGVPIFPVFIFHTFILITGIAGIIASFFKRSNGVLAFMVLLYFNSVHLPYLTASRYSFPVMPFMMMFSAYTCVYLIPWISIKIRNQGDVKIKERNNFIKPITTTAAP